MERRYEARVRGNVNINLFGASPEELGEQLYEINRLLYAAVIEPDYAWNGRCVLPKSPSSSEGSRSWSERLRSTAACHPPLRQRPPRLERGIRSL